MRRATLLSLLTGSLVFGFGARVEAKVVVVGPAGAKAKAVQQDLKALLAGVDSDVVDEAKLAEGQKPPKKPKQRAAWMRERALSQSADLVVAAELKGKKLRLTLFDHRGSAIADRTFKVGARSTLGGGDRADALAWLKGVMQALKEQADKEAAALSALVTPGAGGTSRTGGKSPAPSGGGGGRAASAPPPDAPPPPPEETTIAEAEVAPSGDSPGLLGSALGIHGAQPFAWFRLDLEGLSRGFSYSDPITGNLRPYQAYFLPQLGGVLELHPLVLAGSRALGALGLYFGFGYAFGASEREGGPSFPTSDTELALGARYAIDLGSLTVIPSFGYQARSFVLKAADDGTEETEFPDVSYSGIGGGLGVELPLFAGLTALGGAEYTHVLSPGEVISASYHRAGSVGAIAAELGLRLGLSRVIDVELSGRYQHYFYDFDPEPGDTFIAGGALDQFVTARGSLRLAL